jgi:two-component system, LuxR family, response regulator FixJ
MSFTRTVHVIDDDAAILNSTSAFLRAHGFDVKTYSAAQDFLAVAGPHTTGCVVTDVRMNGMSGLDLTEELRARQVSTPVIIITAHADVSLVVEAMRRGVVDLLEKPFSNRALVSSIHDAIKHRSTAQAGINVAAVRGRVETLTNREREVLSRLLQGSPNKIIARELGVSTRTVESHRATIMSKMNASSLAELVRMSITAS